MRKYKKVKTESDELEETICDFCHKKVDNDWADGMALFTGRFSYGSKYDDETFEFDICDDCFDKKLKKYCRETVKEPTFQSWEIIRPSKEIKRIRKLLNKLRRIQ